MPKIPPASQRSRMVSFRVSKREYEQLKSACENRGGRNLSDFARAAVLQSASAEPLDLHAHFTTFDRKLTQVLERIEEIGKQ